MTLKLTPQTNLESLRKEAKRWLKALRTGDPQAVERLARIYPGRGAPVLRTVQHALALEYGFPNWAGLKRELEERALAARSHAERVTLFLEKSANRYGVAPGSAHWNTAERDNPARGEFAARLLARHPEIARDSIHAAVAAHDVEAVREFLAKDPSLAKNGGGPDGWTPLLRLAYARLPLEALKENGVAIATALLDHGADPNAVWSAHNEFTVLTGVIGGGEGGQSAHPQAEELVRLLIARGAEPFDRQALYNTSLDTNSTLWLELLWSESDKRGEASKWRTVASGFYEASMVDYLIGNAASRHPNRVRWLLEHGANANAHNAYSKAPVIKHALLAGNQEIVDLLVKHGAQRPVLSDEEKFLSAAMQGDAETLRRLADKYPGYRRSAHAMFAAIGQRRTDIAEILLDLGTSPNVADEQGFSALHYTTHSGAAGIASLLIARGATVDAVERRYNSTPLGHANYQGRPEMVAVIAPFSRDIRGLCFAGAVDRLAELLAEDRGLASAITRGEAPLFALPDNDERAVDVAELLLAHGADPLLKNSAGLTPAEVARKRGLDEAAATLSAAEPEFEGR
jgi:ankyrin repeat protein